MDNNKVTVIDKLRKEVFKGINIFELTLFTVFSILGISFFIYSVLVSKDEGPKTLASHIITLVDIPMGIVASMTLSKKSRYAPIFLIFDAVLYGTSNFLLGHFSLGFVNAILVPMLWLFAFFYSWKGKTEEDEKEIKTNKLSISTGVSLIFVVLLISISLALALHWNSIKTSDPIEALNVWFDSFAAALMLAAVIMGMLRFREVWYLYFLANVLKITMFIVNISVGESKDIMLLIMSSSYLINSVFGLFIWHDSTKVSFK